MKKIFTIPNILSFFRICLVPLIVYIYLFTELNILAGCLIVLSGITDIVDGYIARHFNQVSDLGKVLDPFADKLTLISVLTCSIIKDFSLIILLGAEVIKDIIVLITSYIRVKKNNKVHSASWYGKVCTCLSYVTVMLHIFWKEIPETLSAPIIIVVSTIIILFGILYGIDNISRED